MPPEPVPADPGRDEDLTWLDRDPERQTWLARAREHDEPPQEEEYADCAPLTDDELAGIEAAAADELLKARIIALATALLDPDEARAAEQEVLDRAARLTGTAAPGWNPRGTGNAPGPGRSGSPSSSQPGRAARRVRHLAAAHPRDPDPTCWSPWSP